MSEDTFITLLAQTIELLVHKRAPHSTGVFPLHVVVFVQTFCGCLGDPHT